MASSGTLAWSNQTGTHCQRCESKRERQNVATKVMIPTPLRAYTGKKDAVDVEGTTVGEVLGRLAQTYTDLRRHLYSDDGSLRSFVNVYVNDEDIRYLQKEATTVTERDVISIIPSIAGGISAWK